MIRLTTALLLSTALLSGPAFAQSQGDITVGLGFGLVSPKSDNGTLVGLDVEVEDDARPIFTAEYFFMDNVGVELLAAIPFEHDIKLDGEDIGSTKHLPPTVSLNYHFPNTSAFTPYLGVGVNFTSFFSEDSDLGDLDLENSWGLSAQAGLDYQVSPNGAVRLNVRWIDIDTDASLNGDDLGEVEIDPLFVGVSYVHRF